MSPFCRGVMIMLIFGGSIQGYGCSEDDGRFPGTAAELKAET